MDLRELATLQAAFDRAHGWSTDWKDADGVLVGLQKDVVGLIGEIGEFANILQKIERLRSHTTSSEFPDLEPHRAALAEELADSFIYFLRLANRLGIDLEVEFAAKTRKNEVRFQRFEEP